MHRRTFLLPILLLACSDDPQGPGRPSDFEPVARCVGGQAAGYACHGLDLIARVPLVELELEGTPNLANANDVQGWSDALTGRDYLLVGRRNGVSIVDVTDPVEPLPVGRLPSASGESDFRDIDVVADHAFVVADGAPGHGVQVFDLRRLPGTDEYTVFTADIVYEGVGSARSIEIDAQTGYAYVTGSTTGAETCNGGLHMIDVRTPGSPVFAGCFSQPGTGVVTDGYTHDADCVVYDGPDAEHRGREICLAGNVNHLVVVDVTDKAAPVALAVASYPDWGYIQQGSLSPDHRYFLQADGTDEIKGFVERTRLLVWDVTDLDDPLLAAEYLGPSEAVDRQVLVRGNLAYYANSTYGLRVLDVGDPRQPAELAHFDTHPGSDQTAPFGAWATYPFFDNGLIAVSSSRDGLFLLQSSH
ncbi:MAG: choice-of-anchor B family protein [Gemmatimonadota bacterium]